MSIAEWNNWFPSQKLRVENDAADRATLVAEFQGACERYAMRPMLRFLQTNEPDPLLCTSVFMGLYTLGVRSVSTDMGLLKPTFEAFKRSTQAWLRDECRSKLGDSLTGEAALASLARVWTSVKLYARFSARLWYPLKRIPEYPSISALVLMEFKRIVLGEEQRRIVDSVVDLVRRDRLGEEVNTSEMQGAIDLLYIMDRTPDTTNEPYYRVDGDFAKISSIDSFIREQSHRHDGKAPTYKRVIEDPVVSDAHRYYTAQGDTWAEGGSAVAYCQAVDEALQAEAGRVKGASANSSNAYLLHQTWEPLRAALIEALLESKRDEATGVTRFQSILKLADGLKYQLSNLPASVDTVAMFWRSAKLTRATKTAFASMFANVSFDCAQRFLQSAQERLAAASVPREVKGKKLPPKKPTPNDAQLIEELANYACDQLTIIDRHCDCDSEVHSALKAKLEDICTMSVGEFSIGTYIAHYVDELQRGRLTGSGGDAANSKAERLNKLVKLFAFVRDKDVVLDVCRGLLAKRLLDTRPGYASEDRLMEAKFITLVKSITSMSFTSKLEGMLNDESASRTLISEFRDAGQLALCTSSAADSQLDEFDIMVLHASHWPSLDAGHGGSISELPLPRPMLTAMDGFRAFYARKFAARKLCLHWTVGTATLRFRTNASVKRLLVTTAQAIVLDLFNTMPSDGYYTAPRIAELTQLPVAAVKRILHSLACAKGRQVLSKHPRNNAVGDSDQFTTNCDFESKAAMVTMPVPPLPRTDNAQSSDVRAARHHMIDAAVVRTMKARKRLHAEELSGEVMRQLHIYFRPEPRAIKKRIEELIDREYLERDGDDATVLVYLA